MKKELIQAEKYSVSMCFQLGKGAFFTASPNLVCHPKLLDKNKKR